MRLKIVFEPKKDILIPLHYNHIIQKEIYSLLDEKYSIFLHDEGFRYNDKNFKLFTFSRMVIENKEILKNSIRIKPGYIYLTISSIDERFIFDLIDGLLKKKCFDLKEGKLCLKDIYAKKDYRYKKISGLTISPVVVTKPSQTKNMAFHSPQDTDFIISIKNNLLYKYKAFYKDDYCGKLDVKILDENKIKKVVSFYKRWPYDAYLGGFIIEGDDEIVDIAYSCGIGSKNAQGFGCIECISEINKMDKYVKIF